MPSKPRALVITGYGLNCEEETALAFKLAGAASEIVHVNDLIDGRKKFKKYQILAIPGGFSYGDDTGSGNAFANKILNNLGDDLISFAKADKLVIGICNGFQILTNLGLVPACPASAAAVDEKYGERQAALMHNKSTRYEARWIWLKNHSTKSPWTKDINLIHLPVAHGEGNFYVTDDILTKMKIADQIAAQYVHEDGSPANGEFPVNPNGALDDIAAITDPSGRILGIMPHPERFLYFTNEDGWELKKEHLIRSGQPLPKFGAGLKIFQNAVSYFTK